MSSVSQQLWQSWIDRVVQLKLLAAQELEPGLLILALFIRQKVPTWASGVSGMYGWVGRWERNLDQSALKPGETGLLDRREVLGSGMGGVA